MSFGNKVRRSSDIRCGHLSVGKAAFIFAFGVHEDRMDQRGPASRG